MMLSRPILKGSTDQSVVIRIIDSVDGTPETGVVFNTPGIDLEYRREGAVSTDITEATLSALSDAHSDGGILHIGNGYYRLDLPDAAVATGANGVLVHGTVTGMVVIGCYAPLVDFNPYDAVRLGLTALPNAAAAASGGLYIRGTGAGAINQDANGRIDVNVHAAAGTAWGSGAITAASIASNAFAAAKFAADALAAMADANWDELLSGHVAAGSAGQRLALVRANTAQAGAAGTITLDASASATDDFYNGNLIVITAGTGVGQARVLSDYTGSSKVAAVSDNWIVNPSSDSVFVIIPGGSAEIIGTVDANIVSDAVGLATAANLATFEQRLRGLVSAQGTIGSTGNSTTALHLAGLTYGDDEINNMLLVVFDVSESEYHARWISDWVASTDVATVATLPFTPQNATDTYWILPIRQDVTGGSGLDAAGVRAAVGLASANLDTQLGDLPTNAELATSQASADDATLAAIAALPSAAAVWAAGTRTLTDSGAIKRNTALANFEFVMRDSSGALLAGLTITPTRSIDGAAYGACANSASEVGSGTYKIDLAAADVNGVVVSLKFVAAGAETALITFKTAP